MSGDVKMDAHLGVSTGSYAGRIEVLGGPTWRRQFDWRRRRSDAEKARIAAESLAPNAVVADIARRQGATRWRIYDWRRRFRSRPLGGGGGNCRIPAFVPLTVDDGPRMAPSADIIEVMIGDILIRVGRDVGEEHLARIFRAARAVAIGLGGTSSGARRLRGGATLAGNHHRRSAARKVRREIREAGARSI